MEVFFENVIRKPAIPDEDRFERYEARAIGSGSLCAGTAPLTPAEQGAVPPNDELRFGKGTEIVLETC